MADAVFLKHRRESQATELEEHRRSASELQKQLQAESVKLSDLQAELKRSSDELMVERVAVRALQEELTALQLSVSNLEAQLTTINLEKKSSTDKVDGLQSELGTLQGQFADMRLRNEQALQEKDQELSLCRQREASLEKESTALRQILIEKDLRIDLIYKEITESTALLSIQRDKIEENNRKQSGLIAKLTVTEGRVSDLQQLLKEEKTNFDDSKSLFESISVDFKAAVAKNEELESRLQTEIEKKEELVKDLADSEEKYMRLEALAVELQSSYEELKASRVLRTVGAPIQRLSHTPVRASSSSSASSSSPVARSATQEVLTVSSAEDATIPRLRSELQRASEEISSLREQVSESNAKLCVADREISELEDGKIADLVCRIHEWQIQLQLEQSKSADLESELEEAIEELNKAYNENEELRRQVCTLLYMP